MRCIFLALVVFAAGCTGTSPYLESRAKVGNDLVLMPQGEIATPIMSYGIPNPRGGQIQRVQYETEHYFFESDASGYIYNLKQKSQ